MTDPTLDLDAIKARADAATPGPWVAAVGSGPKRRQQQVASLGVASMRGQGEAGCIAVFARVAVGGGRRADDAEFCAAARTDVPALVAEVRRLRAQRDAALAAVDESDDLTPTMLLRRSVRAALGVQPEGN